MSSYASIFSPARQSVAPAARRGGSSLLPAARSNLRPRWTGGEAPSSRLLLTSGKKMGCVVKAGGSPPDWIDFTKPAPSGPPDWVDPNDYTQVTAHEIMPWCIEDAVNLVKKYPPPPLGVHDVDSMLGEYERLSKCAETESIEIYAGTQTFLKLQVKTRECYGAIVLGKAGKEASDVAMTVREATVDHAIRQRLLSRFGVKMDNMPDGPIEHDMAAAMMHSADATRDVVGWYVRKANRIEARRRAREEERKNILQGEEDGDLGLASL